MAVTHGDMTTARAPPGTYSLVYVIYNAITCLLSQDEQVACFRNAAGHLAPGGRFVTEVFVPELRRLPPGETARPFHIGERHVGFDTYDVVNSSWSHTTTRSSTAGYRHVPLAPPRMSGPPSST